MPSDTYTLTIVNQSGAGGNACVFLSPPDMSRSAPTPLAWYVTPATSAPVSFSWTLDYSFVAGLALPVFVSLASAPTDLSTNNDITLTYANETVVFGTGIPGTDGSMTIEVGTVPPLLYAVGVGMGSTGAPAVLLPAGPLSEVTFTPNPMTYWISFGNYVPGQMLNLRTVSSQGAGLIVFPPGVTSLTAVYTSELLWEILPGPSTVPITITADSDIFTATGGGPVSVAMDAQVAGGGPWNYLDSTGAYTAVPVGGPIPAFVTLTADAPSASVTLPAAFVDSGAFIFGIGGLPNLVNTGTTAPTEPADPATVGLIYDVVEFAYLPYTGPGGGGVLTMNTTAVDQFGMPIVLQVTPNSVVLPNGAGVIADRASVFTQYAAFVEGTAFANCAEDMFGEPLTMNILSPSSALTELCVQGVTANPIPATTSPLTGTYYYAVTALNGAGTESVPQSSVVSINPNGQQVTVAWGASQTESTITSTNVYRGTPSGSTVAWTLLNNVAGSGGGSYTDTGAAAANDTAPPATPLSTFFDASIQEFFANYQGGNTITLTATDGTSDGYVYTFQGTTLPATGTPAMLQFTWQSIANLGTNAPPIPIATPFNIYSPYWSTNTYNATLPAPPSWMPSTYPTTLTASAMVFGAEGVFADGTVQQVNNLPPGVTSANAAIYGTLLSSLENQIVSAITRGIANTIPPANWANAPTQLQPIPAALPQGQTSSALTPGTPYYYMVTAVNGTSESIASLEFSAAPTTALPCIEVSWQPLDSSVATSFNVYRGTVSQGESVVISVANGLYEPVSSYVDSGAPGIAQTPPVDYPPGGTWSGYAAFFHQPSISINGAAYASPYDDQGNDSSTLSAVNPTGATITLGSWSSA